MDSLPVAEEEVVESSSNRLGDIYTFVAEGCYPQTMNPIRKKNLKRYAQKFIIDGESKACKCYIRNLLLVFQCFTAFSRNSVAIFKVKMLTL